MPLHWSPASTLSPTAVRLIFLKQKSDSVAFLLKPLNASPCAQTPFWTSDLTPYHLSPCSLHSAILAFLPFLKNPMLIPTLSLYILGDSAGNALLPNLCTADFLWVSALCRHLRKAFPEASYGSPSHPKTVTFHPALFLFKCISLPNTLNCYLFLSASH